MEERAMGRLVDTPLADIRRLLHSLHRRVDDLVSAALISLKDPLCGLGIDAEQRDLEINSLEKELQEAVSTTLALFHPVARDNRFLLAVWATTTDLEHMGDCAKHICHIARGIGTPLESLSLLHQVTQRRAIACFRVLYQLDTLDISLADEVAAGRHEAEEVLDLLLSELEEASPARLSARARQAQLLVAVELKRICDFSASIVDQLFFYKTGSRQIQRQQN